MIHRLCADGCPNEPDKNVTAYWGFGEPELPCSHEILCKCSHIPENVIGKCSAQWERLYQPVCTLRRKKENMFELRAARKTPYP